jgi:beta-galactosidase
MGCLLWVALVASGCAAHDSKAARETILLDRGWRFHLGDMADAVSTSYDDRDWRILDVPHDYVVEGEFTQKNPFVYPGMNTSW